MSGSASPDRAPQTARLHLPGVEADPKPGVFYNRWITATGVPEMSDGAHRAQGRGLATRGYIRE
jgi:hypothetical protein